LKLVEIVAEIQNFSEMMLEILEIVEISEIFSKSIEILSGN
jgi:hypothetical protein